METRFQKPATAHNSKLFLLTQVPDEKQFYSRLPFDFILMTEKWIMTEPEKVVLASAFFTKAIEIIQKNLFIDFAVFHVEQGDFSNESLEIILASSLIEESGEWSDEGLQVIETVINYFLSKREPPLQREVLYRMACKNGMTPPKEEDGTCSVCHMGIMCKCNN